MVSTALKCLAQNCDLEATELCLFEDAEKRKYSRKVKLFYAAVSSSLPVSSTIIVRSRKWYRPSFLSPSNFLIKETFKQMAADRWNKIVCTSEELRACFNACFCEKNKCAILRWWLSHDYSFQKRELKDIHFFCNQNLFLHAGHFLYANGQKLEIQIR